MRRHFEDSVEHESATLEEDIAPVPAIIFDDMMSFGLDPKVKRYQDYPADPPVFLILI